MVALNTRWITWLALLVVMSFLVTCTDSTVDRVPGKELRERPGIDDVILVLQQNRLRWYGLVLQKEDTDW